MPLLAAFLALASCTSDRIEVALAPRVPEKGASLRWSPKGAKVELAREGSELVGRFALGPDGLAPIGVRLAKSEGAARYDVLSIDRDRDGRFDAPERIATTPKETRGKWWSSFESEVAIAVPAAQDRAAGSRPYPLSLWFVEDPQEPDAAPVLRWSRRGWHEGQCTIGGEPAFVLVTEMEMDGRFDQRDAWAIARDRTALYAADSRSLEMHAWLGEKAWRAVAIDAHGRSLAIEPFDPGITRAEEEARADVYAKDRAAPRAAKPLEFGRDLAAALERARKEGKRVLVDFETTWCGPCATMNALVYPSQAVVDAAKDVIAVKVDGDVARDLVAQYGVGAYPTIVLLAKDGKEVRRAVGYRGVAAIVEMLKP